MCAMKLMIELQTSYLTTEGRGDVGTLTCFKSRRQREGVAFSLWLLLIESARHPDPLTTSTTHQNEEPGLARDVERDPA